MLMGKRVEAQWRNLTGNIFFRCDKHLETENICVTCDIGRKHLLQLRRKGF